MMLLRSNATKKKKGNKKVVGGEERVLHGNLFYNFVHFKNGTEG